MAFLVSGASEGIARTVRQSYKHRLSDSEGEGRTQKSAP